MREQVYYVIDEKGKVVFDGTMKVLANHFGMSENDIRKIFLQGKKLNGWTILTAYQFNAERTTTTVSLQEHLFNEDGTRRYEFRHGYPNRYKDASCRRFTPL